MDEPAALLSLEVPIARSELMRFAGYPEAHEPAQRLGTIADEVLAEARQLSCAQGCYRQLGTAQASLLGLAPIDAEALVIGLVTAGTAIERRAAALMASGDITRGLFMDAAGSAAAEDAANAISKVIVGGCGTGAVATACCRLSPGYGNWPLSAQPALFALLPHERVGISLTETHMMNPRKSISFAMWLGAKEPIAKGRSGCAACGMHHCRYRRPTSNLTESST